MDSQDEKTVKQNFLRTMIEKHSFCQDDFANFFAAARENGLDVDSWTLPELQTKAKEYEVFHSPNAYTNTFSDTFVELSPPFDIRIKNQTESIDVVRNIDHVYWIFARIAEETPHIQLMKPLSKEQILSRQGDQIREDIVPKIGLCISHLLTFRSLLRSSSLEAFLTFSAESWTSFVKKSKSKKSQLEFVFDNFTLLKVVEKPKVLQGNYTHHPSFPENIESYLVGAQASLKASADGWGVIDELLQRLQRSITETSQILASLSKIFGDTLSTFESAKFNLKDCRLMKLYANAKDFFASWSEQSLKESAIIKPTIQSFAESIRKRHLSLSNVS